MLTGFQLIKNFLTLYEPDGSLPHSQVPATCPYPEPARSSTYPHISLLKIDLNNNLPSMPGSPKWSLSLSFPTKTLYIPLLSHYALHAQPIPFFSILSPAQYWVRSTNPNPLLH